MTKKSDMQTVVKSEAPTLRGILLWCGASNPDDEFLQKGLARMLERYAESSGSGAAVSASPNEDVKRDAARYWRLRVLGCAPCDSKQLEDGTVLRFSNLDEFIDRDIKYMPSRGEAEIYAGKLETIPASLNGEKRAPEPRYTAKEIISLIRSAEWEDEFMHADDESYVAFITGKLAQLGAAATTQGTPEGKP